MVRNDREALRRIGIANVIRDAADELDRRGVSRGTAILPTGEVDVWGGCAIAVGVAPERVADELETVIEGASPVQGVRLEATWEFLDSALQEDPAMWGDREKDEEIVRRLRLIADELEAG